MDEHEGYEAADEVEQRRTLAAQLQEKMHQDQQQLASNEQQNELLKTKLSLIKSRSKAKRDSVERDGRQISVTKSVNDASMKSVEAKSSEGKLPIKSNKGKINVLREQLEQNRLRFERHGQQLSEDARSMEAVVEQLRHKLEDSDVTIQQLQAGQLRSVVPLTNDQADEQRDLSCRLVEKETQVTQLMAQNTDLQNTILELQENLKEKDCVIEARTRAITLLSEDMSKKWRANVDMLEETRQQMHVMQENFVSIEAGLNKEIEQLNQQLEIKSKKLLQMEHSLKQTESARFDLAARNAELQEKIVSLQGNSQDGSGFEEAQLKIQELSQALSDANRLAVKLKAEHKAKVKTLNKQIDGLRKECSASEEMARLQNRIAELEDEKALQAQQLDNLQKTLMELQNHDSAIVVEDSQQILAELKLKLEDRDEEIELLKAKLHHAEENKENESSLTREMKQELVEAKSALEEWQIRYEALENTLEDQQRKSTTHPAAPSSYSPDAVETSYQDEFRVKSLQTELEEKESELKQVKAKLHSVETSLVSRVEYLENSFHSKHQQIQELESIIQANVEKLHSLHVANSSPIDASSDFDALRNIINDRENHIKYLEDIVQNLQRDLSEYESLKANFSEVSRELTQAREQNDSFASTSTKTIGNCELCENTENLKTKLMETAGELELKREECSRLESKLKSLDEKLKKVAVNLKVKTVTNKDLEDRVSKCEKIIETNEAQIQELSKEKIDILEKWQIEVSEKDAYVNQVNANLAEKNQVIRNLQEDLEHKGSLITELYSKLNILEAQISDLKTSLEEERKSTEEVLANSRDQHFYAAQISSLQTELTVLQDQLSKETEEKHAAIAKLESFTKNVKLKLAKEKKIRNEMQEKQAELENLLAEKSSVISNIHEKYQQDLANLRQEIAALQLQDQENLATSKHESDETEKSTIKLLSENFTAPEEFSPPPTLETFEIEIEDLCSSLSQSSDLEILLILEEEKKKTLDELQSTFESVHGEIISRLNQIPGLQGERKLFTELQNLVIRVRNRTAVLESKAKKLIFDFGEQMKQNLSDAQQRIQALESVVAELREEVYHKESVRTQLEEKLNEMVSQNSDVGKLLADEIQKSLILEKEVDVFQQSCQDFSDTVRKLELDLQEERNVVGSLQVESQEKESLITELQHQCQMKDSAIQDLQSQIQSQNLFVSTLQAQIQERDFESQASQDKILQLHSVVSALQAETQEKASIIDSLQSQVRELPSLQHQLLELHQQNCLYEEDIKNLQKTEQMLSEAQLNNKMNHETLLKTQQELGESANRFADQGKQLEEVSERAAKLEAQVLEASHKITELQQQLSHISQEYSHNSSMWNIEKDQYEWKLQDLTEQLKCAQHQVTSEDLSIKCEHSPLESDEFLRQQLAEKTAEVETYQRRLIQLQMGMSDSSPGIFNSFNETDSSNDLIELRNKVKELQEALDQQSSNSATGMDSFKVASSMFDTSDVLRLNNQIADLSRELDMLLSEKQQLEKEKSDMSKNILSLTEQLNTVISEKEMAEAELGSLSDLKTKMEVLSLELTAANDIAKQVPDLQSKASDQNAEIEELQRQLECIQAEKEKVKKNCESLCVQLSKLELQARIAESMSGDDRPSIPQTLDTHVSSLQTSDSEMYDECKKGEFVHGTMDESLMEHNIIQLESELRGMVTSQLDTSGKQKEGKEKDWEWDGEKPATTDQQEDKGLPSETAKAREKSVKANNENSLVASLRSKLKTLESERNAALSEIIKLQDKVKTLSQSSTSESTHLPDDTSISIPVDTSTSNDQGWGEEDSWGWGAENAKIEEQHQHEKNQEDQVTVSVKDELKSKIISLEAEKEILEGDKLKLLEDLKASQLRAAKLTRKFKELKIKYDEIVEKKKSSDTQFDSLDQAIEEERLKQMHSLEKELKDVQMELISIRAERDKLQKQVDVFSSANERMLEAKERQDIEVEMWQKRNKDLSNQLQALERRIQELEEGQKQRESTADSQTNSSSPDALNPVAVDQLLKENHTWNTNYEALMQEYQKLRAQHLSDSEQRIKIDAQVAQQKDVIDRLEYEKSYLQDVCDTLKMDLEEANAQLSSRLEDQKQTSLLIEQDKDLLQKLHESEMKLNETLSNLQTISIEKDQLQEQYIIYMEQSRKELSDKLDEISRLREELLSFKCNSDHSKSGLFDQQDATQNVSQDPVLKWDSMVPSTIDGQDSLDVFETLMASQRPSKDDAIAYHANNLEAAQKTILELKAELESLKASSVAPKDQNEQHTPQDSEIQNLQTQVFTREKEIESLQISLAISEEKRKKLENEIMLRKSVAQDNGSKATVTEPGRPSLTLSSPQLSSPPTSEDISFVAANSEVNLHVDKSMMKELDLALRRLYERDVRCDELTLELTRLLEERDSLQLRLSNAIRTNEELRDRLNQFIPSNQDASSHHQAEQSVMLYGGTNDEAGPEDLVTQTHPPDKNLSSVESKIGLEKKLAEIHEVHYGRDKWLREDQELRHQQQMQLLYSSQNAIADPFTEVPNVEGNVIVTNVATPSEDNLQTSDPNDSSSSEVHGSFLGWLWGRS